MAKRHEKIVLQDVPRLLETLACGDDGEQQHMLRLLCPCHNRRYDREVWLAIFGAYECPDSSGAVRDQAGHAIGTLRERARTDPRSQELLRWLSAQGVLEAPLEAVLPVWNPRPSGEPNGLRIPRPPRPPRSRANRRR